MLQRTENLYNLRDLGGLELKNGEKTLYGAFARSNIILNITNEETERSKKENISRQTIEVADQVVEKQMRIVQEIASLLGETAAETKIALAKLKESISNE